MPVPTAVAKHGTAVRDPSATTHRPSMTLSTGHYAELRMRPNGGGPERVPALPRPTATASGQAHARAGLHAVGCCCC